MSIQNKKINVGQVMLRSNSFPNVSEKSILKETLETMNKFRLGVACITDNDDQLLGIITAGDITRKLEGEYEFLPIKGGSETEVTYHLAADLAILIPGFVKRRAESRIIRVALENLRKRVEGVVSS